MLVGKGKPIYTRTDVSAPSLSYMACLELVVGMHIASKRPHICMSPKMSVLPKDVFLCQV